MRNLGVAANGGRYAAANGLMIAAWAILGLAIISGAIPTHNDMLSQWSFWLVPALIWNAVSLRRIGKTWLWLHIAPYVTTLGLLFFIRGLSLSEGQYAYDPPKLTLLDYLTTYAGLPMLLVWPAATVALSLPWADRR